MNNYNITVPCLFGIESVLKSEIQDLGYNIINVDDGRVTFEGDALAICRSNLWLRTGERVLLDIAEFEATTFDMLFEKVKAIPWEEYIPKDGKFWVSKASSIKSTLFSPKDIQTIVKKAIVDRLGSIYHISWFEETGSEYPLRVFIKKNKVYIGIDTSGDALHKRGYRLHAGHAPIRETLAAALIKLSVWNKDRTFIDPFCGSGTLPIEAAMMGANMAPGLNRRFASEGFKNLIDEHLWMQAVDEACELGIETPSLNIQGFDIDPIVLKSARENAARAGVEEFIHFQQRDMKQLNSPKMYGVILTNPPYGERLEDAETVMKLYKDMGKVFSKLESWSYYIITSFEEFERYYGRTSDKKRKLYNGMKKTNLYQYLGPRPPKRR